MDFFYSDSRTLLQILFGSLTKQAIDRWLQICKSRKSNTSNTKYSKCNKMLKKRQRERKLVVTTLSFVDIFARPLRNDSIRTPKVLSKES